MCQINGGGYAGKGVIRMKRATEGDIEAAGIILRQAAQQMLDEGKQQWDHTYPTEVHIRADLDRGVGYVLLEDGEVVGYCAVIFDGEPAYEEIRGSWLSDKPYVVVHRMAVRRDKKGLGLGWQFMALVEQYAEEEGIESFRVDTNFDNYPMLGLLRRLGFTYCGEISYERGSRMAFEKLLSPDASSS